MNQKENRIINDESENMILNTLHNASIKILRKRFYKKYELLKNIENYTAKQMLFSQWYLQKKYKGKTKI